MTLDEQIAVCEAVTPGQWESTRGGVIAITGHDPTGRPFFESIPATAEDMDFIVAARTHYPAALRLLKAIKDEIRGTYADFEGPSAPDAGNNLCADVWMRITEFEFGPDEA